MLTLYTPGNSLLHRCPAAAKLITLCLAATLIMILTDPIVLASGILVVAVGYGMARIPGRTMWRLSRTALVIVMVVAACQAFFTSVSPAIIVGLRILFLITAANLVTLTTRTADLITVVEAAARPLTRWGVHPDRIGVTVALAIRFIPVLGEQACRVREAQAARGVKAPFTLLVPLVIRTLRLADGVGEALEVRGLGSSARAGASTTEHRSMTR
ncbi:MAG: energy-coupling factor transporter transmembrane protein EcfT [Propionibacteriaceae bacterium]|jgi:biotin transport system permease protein|nr:energy-coupling factor transporter transmembrane protein EcfT [Propionibacteriaceae bacterium]